MCLNVRSTLMLIGVRCRSVFTSKKLRQVCCFSLSDSKLLFLGANLICFQVPMWIFNAFTLVRSLQIQLYEQWFSDFLDTIFRVSLSRILFMSISISIHGCSVLCVIGMSCWVCEILSSNYGRCNCS